MAEPARLLDGWVAAAHWTMAAEVPLWPRLAANPEARRWLRADLQRRFGGEMAAVFGHDATGTYLHALLPHLASGAAPALIAAVGCRPAIAQAVTREEFNRWRERLGPRVHRLVMHPAFAQLGEHRAAPADLAAAGAGELLVFWRRAALPGADLLSYLLRPFKPAEAALLTARMPAILTALAELPADLVEAP